MSYGAKFLSDTGFVQYGVDHANPSLVRKTAVVTDTVMAGGSHVTVTHTGAFPIVAWTSSAYCALASSVLSGGVWSFTLICAGAVGTAITVYIFDQASDQTSGWGIKLFDAAGVPTSNNSEFPLKLAAEYVQTPSALNPTTYPEVIDSGKTYAVGHGTTGRHALKVGSGSSLLTQVQLAGRSITGGVELYKVVYQNNFVSSPAINRAQQGSMFAVDVTGY